MSIIQPITESMQGQVSAEVQRYVDMASTLYKQSFAPVEVVFNIKGRAAGIYRCFYKKADSQTNLGNAKLGFAWLPWSGSSTRKLCRQIRFNPWLFAKYPDDSWQNTIPHEVAHYISDCLFGLNNIKPHGVEWQKIMRDFGAEPIVRGDYSLDGIPVRKTRRYNYHCACRKVELTSIRHQRIQNGLQEYRCRDCREKLSLSYEAGN